jgi:hypothetical protein
MISCAYCDHELICDTCQVEYRPPSQEHYEALSHGEDVILCPDCERVLVCHWCKTPYDGTVGDEATDRPQSR